MHVWSNLCKTDAGPPSPEFRAVYPYLTTVQGNRFRFRGGDPENVTRNLAGLFSKHLPARKIEVHLEKSQ
jgi:hypothetical protein